MKTLVMIVGALFDCLYNLMMNNKLFFDWNLDMRWTLMIWERGNWNVNSNFWNRSRVLIVSWFCFRMVILLLLDLNWLVFCVWKCWTVCELKKFKCKKIILLESNWWWMVSWIVVWSCWLCILRVLKLFLVLPLVCLVWEKKI